MTNKTIEQIKKHPLLKTNNFQVVVRDYGVDLIDHEGDIMNTYTSKDELMEALNKLVGLIEMQNENN